MFLANFFALFDVVNKVGGFAFNSYFLANFGHPMGDIIYNPHSEVDYPTLS